MTDEYFDKIRGSMKSKGYITNLEPAEGGGCRANNWSQASQQHFSANQFWKPWQSRLVPHNLSKLGLVSGSHWYYSPIPATITNRISEINCIQKQSPTFCTSKNFEKSLMRHK